MKGWKDKEWNTLSKSCKEIPSQSWSESWLLGEADSKKPLLDLVLKDVNKKNGVHFVNPSKRCLVSLG